jgi:hypothetical protein
LSSEYFVVETQKTRGVVDENNEDTRPYKFGEFNILAVSMQPSSGSWKHFMYTVADWLIPYDEDPTRMIKFQPVPKNPNTQWTDHLETCIEWFLSGEKKTITF